eukprot:8052892-Pyramimonas_sp.AAC.1
MEKAAGAQQRGDAYVVAEGLATPRVRGAVGSTGGARARAGSADGGCVAHGRCERGHHGSADADGHGCLRGVAAVHGGARYTECESYGISATEKI